MYDEIMCGVHGAHGFLGCQAEGAGMVTHPQDRGPFNTYRKQGMRLDALRPVRIQITRQCLPGIHLKRDTLWHQPVSAIA